MVDKSLFSKIGVIDKISANTLFWSINNFSSELILEEEPMYSSDFDEEVVRVEETPEIQEEPAYSETLDSGSPMTVE